MIKRVFIIPILFCVILIGCDEKSKITQNIPNTHTSNDIKVKSNIKFCVLEDEIFEQSYEGNPNISVLTREYLIYDGLDGKNSISGNSVKILVDKVNPINELKSIIKKEHPDKLRLEPNTIVSEKVKDKWKAENYIPENEYYEDCQKDLTFNDIK